MFASTEHAAAWLAGMIDGEGCVGLGKRSARRVSIANTDFGLLRACGSALDVLGIPYSFLVNNGKRPEGWAQKAEVVVSGRANLERLAELVPIQSEVKKRRMVEMLGSYSEAYWKAQQIDATELRCLYETEGWSYGMLAVRFGVSPQAIRGRLIRLEVPLRTIQESIRLRDERRRAA